MKATEKYRLENTSSEIEVLTAENIHNYSKEEQEFFDMFQKKGKAMFLTPKYYDGLFAIKKRELKKMVQNNPEVSLVKVVTTLLGSLPDFIPSEKILELTKFIIESWEAMQEEEKVVA